MLSYREVREAHTEDTLAYSTGTEITAISTDFFATHILLSWPRQSH